MRRKPPAPARLRRGAAIPDCVPGDAAGIAQDPDGRRRRGSESRRKIIEAMLALIRAGHISPSAVQVAEHAGVALRSVFRHFEDMESLYREMAKHTAAALLPALMRPYASPDWRPRLHELLRRRAQVFDRIMPLKTAAQVLRFRSAFLMDDHRRHQRFERSSLEAILPRQLRRQTALFHALLLATSFQAWAQLRQAQGLTALQARAVVRRTVAGLLAQLPKL